MKKRIHLIFFIMFFIILIGVTIYSNFVREQNVFDQMYYSRVHERFELSSIGKVKGLFSNMEQLDNRGRDNEGYYINEGQYYERYKDEYCEEEAELRISFYTDTKEMDICYRVNKKEEKSECYCYKYSVQNKILMYSSNDPNNTKKDFLYKIFLRDWFESNHSLRYSLDYLGNVKIVER